MAPTGLNEDFVLLHSFVEALVENPCPFPFPASAGCPHSGACDPICPSSKPESWLEYFSHHSDFISFLLPLLRTLVMTLGPRTNKENVPI